MDWFDSVTEGIGSLWDTGRALITDDKGDLSSWVKPVVNAGIGALNQSNADTTRSQYLEYLRQKEQQNFASSTDAINAYNAQLMAGGGGGGGNSGAAATEANRQKAAKKANKVTQKNYKELLKMYAPYRQTADKLLPEMTQTYQNSLGLQQALGNFVNAPEQMAKLNGSIPAYNVNIPLPDSVRIK